MFSAFDERLYPHHLDDNTVERMSKKLCEAKCRKEDFTPYYNERLAIRHHKMTIALALPDRKKC